MKDLSHIKGFDWDEGNKYKSAQKHSVSMVESEEVFFNQPLLVLSDQKHSVREERHYALGVTQSNRKLFVSFTVRKDIIRVISVRDMSKKERIIFNKHEKK